MHELESNRPQGNGGQIGRRGEKNVQNNREKDPGGQGELSPDRNVGREIWRTKGRPARSKTVYAGEKDEQKDKIRAEKGEK